MKRLIAYLFQGLLLVVPIAATIYVIYLIFRGIDSLLPIDIPGLGFTIIVLMLIALGYMSSFFVTNPLISLIERTLEKAPLVKVIYTAIRDLMAAFVGEKKRFSEPVLVTIHKESGMQKLGFITRRDLSNLGIKDKVAVYMPHSYNFSGNLFIVPNDSIIALNASGSDVMKFIVSGGVTEL